MAKAKKKVYFPKIRLAELAARPGGMTRDDAVSAAVQSMDSMRGEADGALRAAMVELEKIAFAAGPLGPDRMTAILKHADQVVTLSGMFGYSALDTAARSLCDVADGMLRAGVWDRAPIAVHVQTMHLLVPGGMSLSPDHAAQLLGELAKVAAHFNFGSLADAARPDEFVTTTAAS